MAFDYEIMRDRLKGYEDKCILAYETAADYGGFCNGCSHRISFHAYALEDLGLDWLDCIIVPSFEGIETEFDGVLTYTSFRQTIIDLLRNDRDDQVILEAISDYYDLHNETFEGLNLPDDVVPIFEDYKEDALNYYCY